MDTTEVSQLIKGVVRGKVLVIPYKKENACELGYLNPKCPIKKGEKYAFNAKMEIKSFYPAVGRYSWSSVHFIPTLRIAEISNGRLN